MVAAKQINFHCHGGSGALDTFQLHVCNRHMNRIIEKLQKSNFLFICFAISLFIAPMLVKLILTGTIGPTFNFYFFIIWLPLISIALTFLNGWKEAFFVSILLITALIFSIISYPDDPAMDFRRQIVNQASFLITVACLVSLALQLYFRFKSENKNTRPL